MADDLHLTEAVGAIERLLTSEEQLVEKFIKLNIASWVPNAVLDRCRAVIKQMSRWGYTESDINLWLDRFETIGEDKSEWSYSAEYPSGEPLDPVSFIDSIGELAYYRWASDLAAVEGLKLLGGGHAVLGYKNMEGYKNRNYKKNRLTRLLIKTICSLSKLNQERSPSTEDVISSLSLYDNPADRTIEDIDDEEIGWVDDQGHGNYTALSTLPSKISRLRADIRNKKVNCSMA